MKLRKNAVIVITSLASALVLYVLVSMSRSDPDRLLRETIRAATLQNPDETIVNLDSILAHYPDHVNTLMERVEYSRSESEKLMFLARVQQGPSQKVAGARLLEGNILLDQKRYRDALAAFREAVRLRPSFDEARYRLIPLQALQRKPAAVREQLQAIREIRRLTLAEMVLWITADERLTPFSEAVGYLEAFLQADPNDVDSLRALCIYLAEESQQDAAVGQLKAALQKTPNDPDLLALLGHFLLDGGQITQAAEVLNSLRPELGSSVEQWHALGQLAFASGDLKYARIAAEFAALSTPFERSRTYLYYRVLNALGNHEQTAEWQKRSATLNTLHTEVATVEITIVRKILDPRPVIRVAGLLLELNRPTEAREWIEMARSMNDAAQSLSQLSQRCAEQLASYQEPVLISPGSAWNSADRLRHSVIAGPRQESGTVASAGILLTDSAREMGLQMVYENGRTGLKYLVEAMGGGVSVVDFDHDGWPDLYCPQGGSLGDGPKLPPVSDQLFLNRKGTAFSNVSDPAGIREYGYSQGVAAADINGDGFDDIVVANVGRNTLFLNCGDGTFNDITDGSGIEMSSAMSSSVALADLDGDTDLDLYVVNYVDELKICRDDHQQIATCNPASHAAAADELYENLGDGQFRDVSAAFNNGHTSGKGLGIMIARLDGDLQPDIFISNDTTPNFLFVNRTNADGLQFEELGFSMGVAVNGTGQVHAGMGIACADLDHDLRPDLYVTNFHREANSLFLQRDPSVFQDSTTAAGLREPTLPRLGFGTQALDLDLDGWMELFVTNGHIDDQTDRDIEWKMAPQLFRTVDGLHWSDISSQSGPFMHQKALGRGVSVLDANRDGRQDLAIGYQDRPLALLINESSAPGNSVVLCLIGVSCNRSATNTVVYWEIGGKRLMTELRGGDGYYCCNERRLTLGLGTSELAELIEIHWPDGKVDQLQNVIGNKSYLARQGTPLVEEPL